MNIDRIPDSEFIINDDGSAFHIHVKPEQLTDNIIVCGDPGRVTMIASYFDTQDWETSSREFHAIGGTYHGKPIMAISHGIGPDNIDIVMTELDGLANIDFKTRTPKAEHRTLNIVRIGTSGGLQPYVPVGTPVIASKAIGFDGVINYYADRNRVADLDFEKKFCLPNPMSLMPIHGWLRKSAVTTWCVVIRFRQLASMVPRAVGCDWNWLNPN